MGHEYAIRRNTTNEGGIAFVDANNHTIEHFGVDHSGKGKNLAFDTDILRVHLQRLCMMIQKSK